jgi:DGQHR domain-containing protein
MIINVFTFEQPAGTFYFGKSSARDIAHIASFNPRKYDPITQTTSGGVQRKDSSRRISEIAEYSKTRDASFPTPVILALREGTYTINGNRLTIEEERSADVVDGQHRIRGLIAADTLDRFELPVVLLLDPTEEEKALIFATINGKQTPVPASLVYDLFGVTKARSPQKTAHEIARALNNSSDSPWQGRLKMLGRKTPGSEESLSQGTLIKFLLPLITMDAAKDMELLKNNKKPILYPNCVFNEYFYSEEDAVILKILLNLFNAVAKVWPNEWNNPNDYILTKTTGYTGIMKALPDLVIKGKEIGNLTEDYFHAIFVCTKSLIEADDKRLVSSDFQSSSIGEANFKNYILNGLAQTN